MDTPEIVYDILEGNVQNSFDIIKRLDHGMTVGECHYGMWLTMPADRRPSPEASLSGNYIFWPNFPLRKILLIFLYFKQTKCICVSLREHVCGKHESTRRGLFNLTRSDSVIPILVLLMIGLQSRWHLLRPFIRYKHVALFPTFVAWPTLMCSLSTCSVFPGHFEKLTKRFFGVQTVIVGALSHRGYWEGLPFWVYRNVGETDEKHTLLTFL